MRLLFVLQIVVLPMHPLIATGAEGPDWKILIDDAGAKKVAVASPVDVIVPGVAVQVTDEFVAAFVKSA